MPRARLALTIGVVLFVASCVLPCGPLLDEIGASFPYQDPTPEMLEKQAAEIAAAEQALAARLQITVGVVLVGAAATAYGLWAWHRTRRSRRQAKIADR
ncbi:hypothetical protein GCM10011608_17070 [Micromonospora sonchi]|uniref:Uncharacterized protein n=1 Tax=Micromonospora sonchi TaxID=1763543 RepID=A0A917TQD2_9ACTN|nr:hypothetical protein [Micromonospora sonchi]GGM33168.1 hypothetical protein GCM10011608_17070 [Micromonospora sonchi]